MSRKPQTRYPHVFSKGKGPGFHSQGSWRGAYAVQLAAERAARAAQEKSTTKDTKDTKEARPLGELGVLGGQKKPSVMSKPQYPLKLDPRRWKYLKISPTIANLYKGHLGVAVVLEKRCRCETCGSRNARVYPWWGDATEGALGLEGPPGERR